MKSFRGVEKVVKGATKRHRSWKRIGRKLEEKAMTSVLCDGVYNYKLAGSEGGDRLLTGKRR